jgi:hypothetical protein
MKNWILSGFICAAIFSCQQTENITESEFTGNETVYALEQGSSYNVRGTATFKERVDGSASISVVLSGTEEGLQHPVHLHLGDISRPAADVAALLNPVDGKAGVSETHLTKLADESSISYQQLIEMNACIKIHLASSGPDRDIILAGGNIGKAVPNGVAGGRLGIGVCKSTAP